MSFDPRATQNLDVDARRSSPVAVLRGTRDGIEHAIAGAARRWVIGSGASCDIVIDDPYVSSIHCMLERRPGGALIVRDRSSRNGTFVDGGPIEAAELQIGSYLRVGRTTLVAVGSSDARDDSALALLRGHDPALRVTIEQALKAAVSDCNVLIIGETGTGKDLLARVVHEASRRAVGKFVAVNCGAIPRELISSELFGHDKGSFTGAVADRDGYFVEAHAGTLFLDEIGELPIELQPNLLRALETRRVRRVGGNVDRQVDVRIVSATNRIEGLGTESSKLRMDLFHRLATVVLALPPLRERMGDLVELVEGMLAELAPQHGIKRVTESGWKVLTGYNWPGNVRELRHAVTRAVALGGNDLVAEDFFPALKFGRSPHVQLIADVDAGRLVPYQAMLRGAMEQALNQHGSIRAAALQLGMPKSTFADKAKQWGLLPRPKPRLGLGLRRPQLTRG